jgi:hypothetical protein
MMPSYLANVAVANTITNKHKERLKKFRIFVSEYYGLTITIKK